MNLQTKQDFTALAMRFLSPLLPLHPPGGALLHLGDTGATSRRTIGMEAFSRPLWALAPLWAGGGRANAFLPIYQGACQRHRPRQPRILGNITITTSFLSRWRRWPALYWRHPRVFGTR